MTSRVRCTILPGGLRVVTEQMVGARSASIGVWVNVGSRDETPALHGCSHFLEHLLFKGTRERSALDISVALDAVGGEFNAFTAKEYTCFHARPRRGPAAGGGRARRHDHQLTDHLRRRRGRA
ncbi:insulinase family protein [Nocardioides sp. B-3]|nr:insulinase family protein [Nocardioides sp. B-3]UUZ59765.1 insulinase family protein [Nocardioides sp. B-3]